MNPNPPSPDDAIPERRGMDQDDVDFIESLVGDPSPLGMVDKALVAAYRVRDGIAASPRKRTASLSAGATMVASLLAATALSFVGSASAVQLGQCQDSDRYEIRSGDTLWRISRSAGVDMPSLAAWNSIPNPDLIRVGDSLCLVPPASQTSSAAPMATSERPASANITTIRERATGCANGPQPGAVALMDVLLVAYPDMTNGGIYNCRLERGSVQSHSTHAEGRALDLTTGVCTESGYALMREAVQLPGVQRVLYCEWEWRADFGGDGWALASPGLASWHGYTADGSPPKAPAHVHIELTRDAASWLNAEDYAVALGNVRFAAQVAVMAEVQIGMAEEQIG